MIGVTYAQVTQNLTREIGKTIWVSSDNVNINLK